ncbi:MAG: 3-isopropylmalate dehydratase small subunit [Actinobacteria bacterium]|uniref:3-isopropylmalate dehydratase n=1 Tax=freshwater metagenome TaxID=449393 RepID=A0A6J6NZQ7_9ZZZZ|nr:3-isopropylmalate dehydratase small subunit [Actinomycetota bacterium]
MRELRQVTSVVAIIDRPDIDTDQIIPKQFLKRIERTGYGQFLFYDWMKEPDFELHKPEFKGAEILLAGRNFGCGSSREHAAWALEDYGFRVVIAPSYSDIFRSNSVKTGIATITLPDAELAELKAALAQRNELTVDMETLTITHPDGLVITFAFDEFAQETLVHGLDDIARTLKRDDAIAAYEAATPGRFDTRTLST